MRAQCKWVLLGEDPQRPGVKLSTGLNKGRRWPRENMNKSREWRKSGFPGPVLWKQGEVEATSKENLA